VGAECTRGYRQASEHGCDHRQTLPPSIPHPTPRWPLGAASSSIPRGWKRGQRVRPVAAEVWRGERAESRYRVALASVGRGGRNPYSKPGIDPSEGIPLVQRGSLS
jgi:hypothetical protein